MHRASPLDCRAYTSVDPRKLTVTGLDVNFAQSSGSVKKIVCNINSKLFSLGFAEGD